MGLGLDLKLKMTDLNIYLNNDLNALLDILVNFSI